MNSICDYAQIKKGCKVSLPKGDIHPFGRCQLLTGAVRCSGCGYPEWDIQPDRPPSSSTPSTSLSGTSDSHFSPSLACSHLTSTQGQKLWAARQCGAQLRRLVTQRSSPRASDGRAGHPNPILRSCSPGHTQESSTPVSLFDVPLDPCWLWHNVHGGAWEVLTL